MNEARHTVEMLRNRLTTVSLPQIYCRSCHLSTRSDMSRCLHCNNAGEPIARKAVRRTEPRTAATDWQRAKSRRTRTASR